MASQKPDALKTIFAYAIPVDPILLAAGIEAFPASQSNVRNLDLSLKAGGNRIGNLPVEVVELIAQKLKEPSHEQLSRWRRIFACNSGPGKCDHSRAELQAMSISANDLLVAPTKHTTMDHVNSSDNVGQIIPTRPSHGENLVTFASNFYLDGSWNSIGCTTWSQSRRLFETRYGIKTVFSDSPVPGKSKGTGSTPTFTAYILQPISLSKEIPMTQLIPVREAASNDFCDHSLQKLIAGRLRRGLGALALRALPGSDLARPQLVSLGQYKSRSLKRKR